MTVSSEQCLRPAFLSFRAGGGVWPGAVGTLLRSIRARGLPSGVASAGPHTHVPLGALSLLQAPDLRGSSSSLLRVLQSFPREAAGRVPGLSGAAAATPHLAGGDH